MRSLWFGIFVLLIIAQIVVAADKGDNHLGEEAVVRKIDFTLWQLRDVVG